MADTKRGGKGKSKKGNKRASNVRRRKRKYGQGPRGNKGQPGGRCGSSFCSRATGCDPWE